MTVNKEGTQRGGACLNEQQHSLYPLWCHMATVTRCCISKPVINLTIQISGVNEES